MLTTPVKRVLSIPAARHNLCRIWNSVELHVHSFCNVELHTHGSCPCCIQHKMKVMEIIDDAAHSEAGSPYSESVSTSTTSLHRCPTSSVLVDTGVKIHSMDRNQGSRGHSRSVLLSRRITPCLLVEPFSVTPRLSYWHRKQHTYRRAQLYIA